MKRIDDYLNVSSIALLAVGAALLTAILTGKGTEPKKETEEYQHTINQLLPQKPNQYLARFTVSEIPMEDTAGDIVLVTDGISPHDCSIGKGTHEVRCVWDGSVWYPDAP